MRGRLVVCVAAAWCAVPGTGLAASAPSVRTARGCYVVGQRVSLAGAAFAPRRRFDVTVDGVDFGQATTDSAGGFATSFVPGGLDAGVVQAAEKVDVTDGSGEAGTSFTLTRRTGARFEASRGDPRTLRAPFQAWGFGLDGRVQRLYLHYVSPSGHVSRTVSLGEAGGQCGYLVSPPMRLFPFSPAVGRWTLQVDTAPAYTARPPGPVARDTVVIRRG